MSRLLLFIGFSFLVWAQQPYYYSIEKLPKDVKSQMLKSGSWKKGCPVPLRDLRYLTMSYYSSEKVAIEGEMVVHHEVADEVVDIFQTLYENNFTIESMNLIDDYNASDDLSMAANNTSAFNCRNVPRTTRWSRHSFGKAIDINPFWNPFIDKGVVYPKEAKKYADRNVTKEGMIYKNNVVDKAFKLHGWEWGGDWRRGMQDYQHFFKR
jgi:hypothetical protein